MTLISATICLLDVGLIPLFLYIYMYILFKKKTKAFLKKPMFTDLSLNGIDVNDSLLFHIFYA